MKNLKYLIALGISLNAMTAQFTKANNVDVAPGTVGYVVWSPWLAFWEKQQFLGVVAGPGSTGWRWKNQKVIEVSILPRNYDEVLEIMGSDELKLSISAHATIHPDPNKIKELVENYGAEGWYDQNIKEKFRTIVRQAVGNVSSREAVASQDKIQSEIDQALRNFCKDKPFLVDTVSLGSIQLPDSVANAAAKKVATAQELEAKQAELEKAKKDSEIKVAEAQGIRQAQEIINGTLTPMYLQHEYIQALIKVGEKGNTVVYVPTGKDGMPFMYDTGKPLDIKSHPSNP